MKVIKPNGLRSLSSPLFSKIVDSSMNVATIGATIFSPGFLNQTVDINAKEKLKIIIFKNLLSTNKDNRKLNTKERKKYINQNKIIKS
tara:strand:- start:638 stop:901 length:264 start_codon:yes stop_codon:yes gene_type:complete